MRKSELKQFEVVRQKNGYRDYYTIFSGMDEYCDDDGNPIEYDTYEEAKEDCDLLNEEFDTAFNKINEQMEQ